MVRLGLPKTPPCKAALTTSFVNPGIGGELGQRPLSRFIRRDVSRTALEHIMSVISIQSQVVYGHVGNSAAVFPMQMHGIEVMAVPTTLFSNRPRYPTVRGQVLDAGLVADLLVGLEERGAVDTCQVILTGYLGSPQIGEVVADFVARAMKQNPKLIYCCDPVIGDAERGVFVASGLPELFRDRLCPISNILTPNHFELEWLVGRKLETTDSVIAAGRTLAHPPSSTVVVTGASLIDGQKGRIVTFAIEEKSVWSIATPKLHGSTSGAGDLLAALFVAALIGGFTTAVALADAVSSTFAVLEETVSAGAEEMRIVTSASGLLHPPVAMFRSQRLDK
jgi:pyridoxine kinase